MTTTTTTTSPGIFAATSPLLVLFNGHVFGRPKFAPSPRVSRGLPTYNLRWQFLEVGTVKGGILLRDGLWSGRKQGWAVVVRFNQGFGFGGGGGGGGGGGRDNEATARVVGNLALAIGLTYLTMTGQLGWVLDAFVSIWVLDGVFCLIVLFFLPIWAAMDTCQLLVVLIPIVGFGVFLWWAGRDIVQSSCPNCGNDFQVFKSSLNDELQLCPFCSQPFSVVDNKFVRESVKFSNQFTSNREAANEFSPQRKKGKDSSRAVVDVEAEVVDAD